MMRSFYFAMLLLPSVCLALDAPRLIAPGSNQPPGSVLNDSMVAFRWSEVVGATDYRLTIRRQNTNSSQDYILPFDKTFAKVNLIAGCAYEWQVTALAGGDSAAASATNYFTIAIKSVQPVVTGVAPDPVPAFDGAQVLIVNGMGFCPGCQLVLRDKTTGERFDNLHIAQRRNSQFIVTPNFTRAEDHWSAEVINPGGFSSGQFDFDVVSPAHITRRRWWRSGWPWFWAYLPVIGFFVVGLFYQRRRAIASIQSAWQDGRKKEHIRLSRDLHDSVNGLNQINLLAGKLQVMAQKGEPLERLRETAHAVLSAVVEATNLLEDMIWACRPENENLESLVGRLRQKVGQFREFNPAINCTLDFPFEIPVQSIPCEISANLLRITSELLRNVVKHAQCSGLNCRLAIQDERLCLTIADNGVGFPRDDSRPRGQGLPNLRRRAEKLGGSFKLETSPGNGTTAHVEIPLPRSPDAGDASDF